jgi:hypothetical protein
MPQQSRHSSIDEYKKWYSAEFGLDLDLEKRRYEDNSERMKQSFAQSALWLSLIKEIGEINDRYFINTHFALLDKKDIPIVETKPFESLIDKTYRINEIHNKHFPDVPEGGWILPENWLTKIKDVVRTKLVVRYLDGVTFMVSQIADLCDLTGIPVTTVLEAREQGYYAAHLQCKLSSVLPGDGLKPLSVSYTAEIQVTTYLQVLIQQLSHKHYEENRIAISRPDVKWQWNYRSPQFSVNYLAHILHYIEGMIIEIRDK